MCDVLLSFTRALGGWAPRDFRGSFRHGIIGGATGDCDESAADMTCRPVQGTRVEIDHDNGMTIIE